MLYIEAYFTLYRMIEIILTIFIILVLYYFNKIYLRPTRLIKFYQQKFSQRGYKVRAQPVRHFISSYLRQLAQDTKKGDAFATVKKQYSKYDVVICNARDSVRICLVNPQLIQKMTIVEKDFNLPKSKYARTAFRRLAKGLVFSEKQAWKKRKKIMSQVFNYEFIVNLSSRIAEIFDDVLNQCESSSKQNIQQFDLSLLQYTSTATSSVVLQCFLGCNSHNCLIDEQKLCKFLIPLLDDFVENLIDPVSIVFGQKFVQLGLRQKDKFLTKRLNTFNSWAEKFIDEKINTFQTESQSSHSSDLINAILLYNKKISSQNKQNEVYSAKQILDEFKIFLLAGTDTTSHFLQMMIYYVIMNPEVEIKIREEIETVLEQENYDIKFMKKMVYIDAVMKETLRIYGPVNFIFLRQAQKDCYIDEIPIFKGVYINHMSMAIHYSEKYYQQPEKFRPQRWLNGQCDKNDPLTLIGFNTGPRSCIGRQLALLEGKIGLIKFLKRYKKINISKNDLKFFFKFAYVSENFDTKVTRK